MDERTVLALNPAPAAECERAPKERQAALLLLSFPHQLLHAIGALRHDRRRRGIREDAPATILVWSHQSAHHAHGSAVESVYRDALKGFPWISLLYPSRLERAYALSPYRRLADRAAWIRKRLGNAYGSFYYSHDVSADHTAQAVMQALPTVHCVCYGDPPGFVYPSAPLPAWQDEDRAPAFRSRFWRSRLNGLKRWRGAHSHIVAIDFDSLRRTAGVGAPIHTLPRPLLTDTLASLKRGLAPLGTLESRLIDAPADARVPWLLLLSNFTESGLTQRHSELQLYREICEAHVAPGETIIIKPHIGTSARFLDKLMRALSPYRPLLIPSALQVLPVEFLTQLLSCCRILSVSSSSALIAHLFSSDRVTHALDADRIQRYFRSERVAYMQEANAAILRALQPPRCAAPRLA